MPAREPRARDVRLDLFFRENALVVERLSAGLLGGSVVGSALTVQGYLSGVTQFVSYALGMGLVIVVLTLALALFKGVVVGLLRRTLPYFQTLSAVLLLLAGVYLVYYWLTVGQLAQAIF